VLLLGSRKTFSVSNVDVFPAAAYSLRRWSNAFAKGIIVHGASKIFSALKNSTGSSRQRSSASFVSRCTNSLSPPLLRRRAQSTASNRWFWKRVNKNDRIPASGGGRKSGELIFVRHTKRLPKGRADFQGKHLALLSHFGGMRIIPKCNIGSIPPTGGLE
jgi:hypothetical protein